MRRVANRYDLLDGFGSPFASGATATVHLARVESASGPARNVAIKRLHPHLASSPELRTLLVDEAKVVARVVHPNVVQVVEVVEEAGEVFLVMEYLHGETLGRLISEDRRPPPAIAVAIARDMLHGIHAAHHARGCDGKPLGLIHRDVNPRNVLVTTSGTAKIIDFGIAKSEERAATTRMGFVRGTLAYMAPEQLEGACLTNAVDTYAVAVILWELLTGRRLFDGDTDSAVTRRILDHDVRAPGTFATDLPRSLDAVVLRGLARSPAERFPTALEMAFALEQCQPPAKESEVAAWVMRAGRGALLLRERDVRALEEAHANASDLHGAASAKPGPHSLVASSAASLARSPAAALRPFLGIGVVVLPLAVLAFSWRRTPTIDPALERPPSENAAIGPPSTPSSTSTSASPVAVSVAKEATTDAASTKSELRTLPVRLSGVQSTRGAHAARVEPKAATLAPVPSADGNGANVCPPYFVDSSGRRRFNRECLR